MAVKSSTPAPTFLSKSTSLSDYLLPHRNEAAVRVRNGAVGVLTLFLLTYLLPLPTPFTSIIVVAARRSTTSAWWFGVCATELAVLCALVLNILQGLYAIKYPRAPHPPLPSPAKTVKSPPQPQKRRLTGLSPQTSPQQQRSFSSSYASSPISTPSRTLYYNVPSSASPFDTSINSSISLPSSPSPILSSPLAAYRGKRASNVGHAFDGSLLSRLAADDSDTDE